MELFELYNDTHVEFRPDKLPMMVEPGEKGIRFNHRSQQRELIYTTLDNDTPVPVSAELYTPWFLTELSSRATADLHQPPLRVLICGLPSLTRSQRGLTQRTPSRYHQTDHFETVFSHPRRILS